MNRFLLFARILAVSGARAEEAVSAGSIKASCVAFEVMRGSSDYAEVQVFKSNGGQGVWDRLERSKNGWQWLVASPALLNNSHVAKAEVVPVEPGVLGSTTHVVQVRLNAPGTTALSELSRTLLNKQVTFYVDGKFINGITIRSPITSGRFQLHIEDASLGELERIANGIRCNESNLSLQPTQAGYAGRSAEFKR